MDKRCLGLRCLIPLQSGYTCVLFPAASTTVQVTVVTPIGKVAGALFVTDATAQLSAVTGDPRATVAKQSSASVVAVMFDGQTMLGASLSDTVTV